jgi:hypothetical protein
MRGGESVTERQTVAVFMHFITRVGIYESMMFISVIGPCLCVCDWLE